MDFQPSKEYHAHFARKSLDDNPLQFSAKQLEKISLNNGTKAYCENKWLKRGKVDKSQAVKGVLLQDWSIKRLQETIDTEELIFLNVFDLTLQPRRSDVNSSYFEHDEAQSQISISDWVNRTYNYYKQNASGDDRAILQDLDRFDEGERGRIWSIFLDGNFEEYFNVTKVRRGAAELEGFNKNHKERLLYHLADSRYLSSPGSSVPRFEDLRDKGAGEWKTSIALHHWKTASTTLPKELTDVFSEGKESGPIPPRSSFTDSSSTRLGSKEGTTIDVKGDKTLEERSSSIVISGDYCGDFWICTILSSSINEQDMDDMLTIDEIQKARSRIEQALKKVPPNFAISRKLEEG
ncbi:MAG: hypothetical protein Q9217_006137 [Psora testacea]